MADIYQISPIAIHIHRANDPADQHEMLYIDPKEIVQGDETNSVKKFLEHYTEARVKGRVPCAIKHELAEYLGISKDGKMANRAIKIVLDQHIGNNGNVSINEDEIKTWV